MWPRLFDKTVTILSMVRGTAEQQYKDQWYKYVVPNCMWQYSRIRTVSGITVSYGNDITVRIPKEETDKLGIEFMRYADWSKADAGIDRTKYFTVDSTSYVILGEVTEEVTSSNIVTIRTKYTNLIPRQVADNLAGFAPHIRVSGL